MQMYTHVHRQICICVCIYTYICVYTRIFVGVCVCVSVQTLLTCKARIPASYALRQGWWFLALVCAAPETARFRTHYPESPVRLHLVYVYTYIYIGTSIHVRDPYLIEGAFLDQRVFGYLGRGMAVDSSMRAS